MPASTHHLATSQPAADTDGMIYREWMPPPSWRHAVSCIWEQVVTADRVQQILPDGHADLIRYDDGRLEVVGLHDHLAETHLPAGTHVHGVRLRPEAVGPAFRSSADALRNVTVDATDVVGSRRAAALGDDAGLDRWIRSIEPDARTANAVRMLGRQPLSDVADELGITSRHLRRVLLNEVGLPPKTYQRVLRLRRFLDASDDGQSIAAAAAAAGYVDQPHLSRETRMLTAHTPARLVEMRRLAC